MHKKRKIITTSILIVAVILLISASFLYKWMTRIKDNPAGTLGNTSGNLQNGGLFCENDGVVYFSNPYDNGSLYSMNPDESNIKKVVDGNIQCINAAGKYLYYYSAGVGNRTGVGYLFDASGIFRLKKNSNDSATYIKKSLCTSLALIDNYLYYQIYSTGNHLALYKEKIDGTEEQLLSEQDISPSCLTQSAFFFNQPGSSMHLQLWNTKNDTSREFLSQDVFQPVIDGNYVYYIDIQNNYGISRLDLTSMTVTPVIEGRVDCFNIAGGHIYYQTSGEEYAIKTANMDGSNATTILSGVFHSINATSQYVYFKQFDKETPLYKVAVGSSAVQTFDAAKEAVK